ncbi:hypothetical protein GCM10018790_79660 [Kitasatospora xanthocidica]|nr:hypothetical protein GCM10018790_79660 [Kitasatospora xanthocidica]
MRTTGTPRTATLGDAASISRSLAPAFDDDPMMCWFFPDEASRRALLGRYFATLFTCQYVHAAVCERTANAAAFWVPPEARAKAVPDAATVRELTELLGDRAELFGRTVEEVGRHAAREPHWYLALIGADPAAQGQGQGAALLRCCAPGWPRPTPPDCPSTWSPRRPPTSACTSTSASPCARS